MGSSKLTLVALVGLAALAFGASYAASRYLAPGPTPAAAQDAQPGAEETAPGAAEAPPPGPADLMRLEERHLYDLVKEVRRRLRECELREQALNEQAHRVQMAHDELQGLVQDLENRRVEAASTVAKLRQERAALDQTRLVIAREQADNLKRTAAIYNKMDAESAAQIFEGMVRGGQEADAVKILYGMDERAVAKVLAAIPDRATAVQLSEGMKHVTSEG